MGKGGNTQVTNASAIWATAQDEGTLVAEYTLPDLDYDYSALEPHISGQINELHHYKHHATYVAGANTALEKLAEARENDDHAAIFLNEKNLAFHLGGHVNHSIWWKNLSPDGGDKPDGDLAAAIDDQFGSFDKFRAQFTAAANGLQGSGWAVLGYDTLGKKLLTFQLYDQQANVPLGHHPAAAGRHVGARLLPAVQERQGRLRQGVLERRELGRRRPALRRRHLADSGPDLPVGDCSSRKTACT